MTIRSDNADLRLTEKGHTAGAVSDVRWSSFQSTRDEIAHVVNLLKGFTQSPQGWGKLGLKVQLDGIMRRYLSPPSFNSFSNNLKPRSLIQSMSSIQITQSQ